MSFVSDGPCNEEADPGDCKPLNQCPQVIAAIQQNKTSIEQVTCYVDSSTPVPYVCCPNGKPPKPKPTATAPPVIVNRVVEAPADSRISVKSE